MHFTETGALIKCTLSACEKTLRDAEVTKYDIGDVLSVEQDDVDAQGAGDCAATLCPGTKQL